MKKFHIVTLFEEACDAYLNSSILGRARSEKKISVDYANPRDFVEVPKGAGKFVYRKVDERPYGGGPGMVMLALPVVKATAKLLKTVSGKQKAVSSKKAIIWFTPAGTQFSNAEADKLAKYDELVFICGRYEGVDERAVKMLKTLAPVKKYSIGPYVVTGGEVPAMIVIDAITRRLPGVLGKDASVEERRISSNEVYTRPETLVWNGKKYKVPKVLQTGNHAEIDAWRAKRNKKV